MTMMIFIFCFCSLAVSFYVMFTLQNKTLTLKDREWRVEQNQKELDMRMEDIEQRERRINHKLESLKLEELSLEKKRQEYVVFDFK